MDKPVMPLSAEEIESLRESCASIAHLNWDGGCTITVTEDNRLCIKMHAEDDSVESMMVATYEGQFKGPDGHHDIWSLQLEGEENRVFTTLVPVLIVGYAGL